MRSMFAKIIADSGGSMDPGGANEPYGVGRLREPMAYDSAQFDLLVTRRARNALQCMARCICCMARCMQQMHATNLLTLSIACISGSQLRVSTA